MTIKDFTLNFKTSEKNTRGAVTVKGEKICWLDRTPTKKWNKKCKTTIRFSIRKKIYYLYNYMIINERNSYLVKNKKEITTTGVGLYKR